MSERMILRFGEREFETSPENTTLYTFLGKTALHGVEMENSRFNHMFFVTGEESEETVSGSYMFRTEENAETWDTIAQFLADNAYPMILNRRDVPDCDVTAYMNMLENRIQADTDDLGDFIPEGWS